MPPAKKPPRVEPVATAAKALVALRAFIDGQDEWGVRELAVALDMPPSTVHRLLTRLRLDGFVGFDQAHQKYNIGFEFTRLAAAVMQRHGLRQAALPLMKELTDQCGESVWLAIFDEDSARIAYVAESESPHASRYVAPLGQAFSTVENACGIAVLAALPAAERKAALKSVMATGRTGLPKAIEAAIADGYVVQRATEVGSAMMISAAILNAGGRPVGSFGIVIPTHRFGDGQARLLGLAVQTCANKLSNRLGARLLGGASVGSWQDAVGAITSLLREKNRDVPIVAAPGRGARNLEDVDRGLAAYAFTVASSVYDARHGGGPFTARHTRLRTVMHLSELHLLVVARRDAGATRVADLARLRVSPGEEGFSSDLTFDDLLRSARTSGKAVRATGTRVYLDYPEAKRQLEAGGVDAIVWMTTFSNPLIRELSSSRASARACVLWDLDADIVRAMAKANPGYRRASIEQREFPDWLSGDVHTVAVPTVLVCRDDRPDQEVYEMTRTIYEARATLSELSSVYSRLDADFVASGLIAPLHPGAERYFRENGIKPSQG